MGLLAVLKQAVEGTAGSCQRGELQRATPTRSSPVVGMTFGNLRERLETAAKVGSTPGIPANTARWSLMGEGRRRHKTGDHGGSSHFCMAEHTIPSLAHEASRERPAQPLTWELASGGTHHGTGQVNGLSQRDCSHQGAEPSPSSVSLSPSGQKCWPTMEEPWKTSSYPGNFQDKTYLSLLLQLRPSLSLLSIGFAVIEMRLAEKLACKKMFLL